MGTSRTQFKYAHRSAKREEETERANALADDLYNKKCDDFVKNGINQTLFFLL